MLWKLFGEGESLNMSMPPAYSEIITEQHLVWSMESQSAGLSDLSPPPRYFEDVEDQQ